MKIMTVFGLEEVLGDSSECSDCKQTFPRSADYFRPVGTYGKTTFRSKCHSCERIYKQTAWRLKKRAPPKTGNCRCCDRDGNNKLFMDHDHKTLKIRGMICKNCNSGIAFLGDNHLGALNAVRYFIRVGDITVDEVIDWVVNNG